MLTWLKNLFKKNNLDDVVVISASDIDDPIFRPNTTQYTFPNPGSFTSVKVKFKSNKRRKKKDAKNRN